MSAGIDPRAIVDPSARIGENVEIGPFLGWEEVPEW